MTAITDLDPISGSPWRALVALSETISRWFRQRIEAYRNRRDASALAAFDDRMLADIGLTRSDVRDAFAEPLWQDPTELLRMRAIERRRARHHVPPLAPVAAPPLAPTDGYVRPDTDRPARFTV